MTEASKGLQQKKYFSAGDWHEYALLDSGNGAKLERWGGVLLDRPDPQALWSPAAPELWKDADAAYSRSRNGGGSWRFSRSLPDSWVIGYRDLRFIVKPTGFKHTGLFPEQAVNWDWITEQIKVRVAAGAPPRVLNLFAYTGGATVAAAAAGAAVTHVDSAKGMVRWAGENIQASGLQDRSVRYIVDDVFKFVSREIRRGSVYDGIIMDPPSYGRGANGEKWLLEEHLLRLLQDCAALFSSKPAFMIVNTYTTGLSPLVLQNLLQEVCLSRFGGGSDCRELVIPEAQGRLLPCGVTGRWYAADAK